MRLGIKLGSADLGEREMKIKEYVEGRLKEKGNKGKGEGGTKEGNG